MFAVSWYRAGSGARFSLAALFSPSLTAICYGGGSSLTEDAGFSPVSVSAVSGTPTHIGGVNFLHMSSPILYIGVDEGTPSRIPTAVRDGGVHYYIIPIII